MQGRLQGVVDATCVQIGLRGRELHPELERIHSVFVHKSATLDSCRFETRMRQNAPNPISISFLSGVTPGPPPLGALPQTPGEGRGGREEKGQGEGKGTGGKGEGGEREGREEFASLPLGDRRP